jgi:hypothetical protein
VTKGVQLTLVLILLGLFALFYQGLWGDPRHIPTVLIGTDAPMIEGPDVETGQTISLDQFTDAQQYLKEYGTTFAHMRDLKGQLAIDYGVYGVPETFIIDQQGKIRYKYVGPVTGHMYTTITQNIIAPLLKGQPISTPS